MLKSGSPFSVLRSPFSVLRSPFSVLRSPFLHIRRNFSLLALIVLSLIVAGCDQPTGNSSVNVTSVTLDKPTLTLTVGNTETLVATVEPANAKNKNVTWMSGAPTIASVENGRVTAHQQGSAIIFVTTQDGGKIAQCTVTVTAVNTNAVTVTDVTLNKTTLTLYPSDVDFLTATVSPPNATNKNVTWSSNNTDAAFVDSTGKVTAVATGTTIITVTTDDGNKTAFCAVTVQPVPSGFVAVTGVSLNKTTLTLNTGNEETLIATISPADATNQNVNWSTNAAGVAAVDSNGKVTAIGVGTAAITVTTVNGGRTATSTVTVAPASSGVVAAVTGVTLSVAGFSVKPTNLRPGNRVVLDVTVSGTGNFSPAYAVTATEGAGDVIIGVDGTGRNYLTVKATAASGTSVKVKAESVADTTKSAEWPFVVSGSPVVEGTPVDPANPSFTTGGVTGITLKIDGAAPPFSLPPPSDKTVTAEVTTTGTGVATTYQLTLEDVTGNNVYMGKVALNPSNGRLLIQNDAVQTASFKITATSDGDIAGGAAGAKASTSATIVVGAPPVQSGYSWKIVNTKGWNKTLNAKTTDTVPIPQNKRYTVVNNEAGSEIGEDTGMAASSSYTNIRFRDVTILYLDHPFIYNNWEVGQEFGIEARMRVKEHRDSAPVFGSGVGESWGSGRQGVMMAAIAGNPEELVEKLTFDANGLNTYTIDDVPHFVAWRILSSGQHRGYALRGYNTAGTTAEAQLMIGSDSIAGGSPIGTSYTFAAEIMKHDYLDGSLNYDKTKQEGFRDQEYIYSLKRESYTGYNMKLLGPNYEQGGGDTGGLVNDLNYRRGTDKMRFGYPIYLAFIVYGVTVEISDIKIYANGQLSWIDPAVENATPLTPVVKWANITTQDGYVHLPGDTEYDYSCLATDFPAGGVTLTAEVVPLTFTGNKNVTWSVSPPNILAVNNGVVTRIGNATGVATVTATPAAGGANGTFKFLLWDGTATVTPTFVDITTYIPFPIENGNTIYFEAYVHPFNAPRDVTWEVFAEDGISPTTAASFAGNVLTTHRVTEDMVIKVVATAAGTSVKSEPVTYTIMGVGTPFSRFWTFGWESGVGWWWEPQNGNGINITDIDLGDGLQLFGSESANGTGWLPNQNGLVRLGGVSVDLDPPPYTGTIQPRSATNTNDGFGRIDVTGEIGADTYYKVSIAYTTTSDSTALDRHAWISFDGGVTKLTNPNDTYPTNGSNNGAKVAYSKDDITWSAIGKGPAVFGFDASVRIWEIKVEELQ